MNISSWMKLRGWTKLHGQIPRWFKPIPGFVFESNVNPVDEYPNVSCMVIGPAKVWSDSTGQNVSFHKYFKDQEEINFPCVGIYLSCFDRPEPVDLSKITKNNFWIDNETKFARPIGFGQVEKFSKNWSY